MTVQHLSAQDLDHMSRLGYVMAINAWTLVFAIATTGGAWIVQGWNLPVLNAMLIFIATAPVLTVVFFVGRKVTRDASVIAAIALGGSLSTGALTGLMTSALELGSATQSLALGVCSALFAGLLHLRSDPRWRAWLTPVAVVAILVLAVRALLPGVSLVPTPLSILVMAVAFGAATYGIRSGLRLKRTTSNAVIAGAMFC